MAKFTRRHFFYGSLLAGAVPMGGFGSTPSLKTLGYKSPNEKLNIASIGAGGKAAGDIRACAQTENIIALCDVDEKRAERTYKEYEKLPKYKDFRVMLDREEKDVDAVIVTIPDFMHAAAAIHAMERRQACLCPKAACAHRLGMPRTRQSRREIQSRHPDGQPRLLE
jgi:shikimate 5-dehydrogenase